jgi:hypothetical protein
MAPPCLFAGLSGPPSLWRALTPPLRRGTPLRKTCGARLPNNSREPRQSDFPIAARDRPSRPRPTRDSVADLPIADPTYVGRASIPLLVCPPGPKVATSHRVRVPLAQLQDPRARCDAVRLDRLLGARLARRASEPSSRRASSRVRARLQRVDCAYECPIQGGLGGRAQFRRLEPAKSVPPRRSPPVLLHAPGCPGSLSNPSGTA